MLYIFFVVIVAADAVAKEKWTSSHTLCFLSLPPPSKSEKKNYVQFNFFLALSAYAMDTHNSSSPHPLWSLRFIYANFLFFYLPPPCWVSPFHTTTSFLPHETADVEFKSAKRKISTLFLLHLISYILCRTLFLHNSNACECVYVQNAKKIVYNIFCAPRWCLFAINDFFSFFSLFSLTPPPTLSLNFTCMCRNSKEKAFVSRIFHDDLG